MSKLTSVQRAVLSEVASGAELRWEQGEGLRVGDRRVRPTTVCALSEAGLVKAAPYAPDADRIDYLITEAGFEALGIRQTATGPGVTAGMRTYDDLDAMRECRDALDADKPIEAHLFMPDLGLIHLPEMAAEDQAALLAMVRKRVPDFGHRAGYLESSIVGRDGMAVLLLSTDNEPTYMAIFCEDMATAAAIITVYAAEEGMELEQARHFTPDGAEHTLDLGGGL